MTRLSLVIYIFDFLFVLIVLVSTSPSNFALFVPTTPVPFKSVKGNALYPGIVLGIALVIGLSTGFALLSVISPSSKPGI